MRSFDIFVDGHHIQSDLVVVNLPVRNDIAAYYKLIVDSSIVNNIIAEKLMLPGKNTGSIVLDATADNTVVNYEVVDSAAVALHASVGFSGIFPFSMDSHTIELRQDIREISQKFGSVSLPIVVGVADGVDAMPLKSIGRMASALGLDIAASEVKQSLIGSGDEASVAVGVLLIEPDFSYYENAESDISIGAEARSLSYLKYLPVFRSAVNLSVNALEFELLRSTGRLRGIIEIGADATFVETYFTGGESSIVTDAEASATPYKILKLESAIAMKCEGAAVLRYARTLTEIDEFGALSNIDNMTLEDMYYKDTI